MCTSIVYTTLHTCTERHQNSGYAYFYNNLAPTRGVVIFVKKLELIGTEQCRMVFEQND